MKLRERLLHVDMGRHGDAVEVRKVFAIEIGKLLVDVHVAIEEDIAVRRMVVFCMEARKHLLRELRDGRRVAAGFMMIRRVGVQRLQDAALQEIVRRRERALHLIVDDAAVAQRLLLVRDLVVPALLHQDLRVLAHRGIEHCIEVDVHEVLEIFVIPACDGVHRLVRVRHGIEERVEAAFDEFDERFLQRVLARAAERRMLHDVRDARVIRRRRAERDRKDLVVVRRLEIQQARTALLVLEDMRRNGSLRHVLDALQAEPMIYFIDLHRKTSPFFAFKTLLL